MLDRVVRYSLAFTAFAVGFTSAVVVGGGSWYGLVMAAIALALMVWVAENRRGV